MTHADNPNHATETNGSAVIMARIVDALGRGIQRMDVVSICYSLVVGDPARPDDVHSATGYDRVLLSVDEVLYDALQSGAPWNVDELGYNFRHDLKIGPREALPNGDTNYELRYELMPKDGEVVILRFQLAGKHKSEARRTQSGSPTVPSTRSTE